MKVVLLYQNKILTDKGIINIEDLVPEINKNLVTPSIETTKMKDYLNNFKIIEEKDFADRY